MRVPHTLDRMSSVLRSRGSAHTLWTLLPHPSIIRKDAQTPIRRNAGRDVIAAKLLAAVNPPLLDARTDRQPGEDLHPKTFRLRAPADQEMPRHGIGSAAWIPGCGYQRPFCTGYEAVPRLSRSGVAARRAAFARISRSNTSRLRYRSLIDWEHQQPPQRGPQAA